MHVLQRSILVATGLLAFAACGDVERQPLAPPPGPPRLTVTSATVTCPDTISVGQSAQCVAYFYDQNNNLISPVTPTWSTTTPTVDSVTTAGVVIGKSVGSGNVKATYQGVTGTKNLYVKPGLSVAINGPSLTRRWTTCTYVRSVSGGTSPYTYLWSDDNGTGSPTNTGTTWTVDMISAGNNLYLTVTDANGVQGTATLHITSTSTAPLC